MGGERTRKGKHVLFFPACCIALILGICGCTHLSERWKGRGGMTTSLDEGKEHLASAKSLLLQGEYEACLKEAQEVLRSHPKVLGGEALFLVGLVYASPDNPNGDYKISEERFRRLIVEFPRTGLEDQAEVMIMFVRGVMDRDKKLRELQGKNGRLVNAYKTEKAKAQELKREAERSHEEVQRLREQLVKFKEIDLVIQEKKQAQ